MKHENIIVRNTHTNNLKGIDIEIPKHNLDIIKYADWVIDMGPEGGKNGGEVLFQGTPEELVLCPDSYTGRFLKKVFS